MLPLVYLPGTSSCNPLVSPQLQSPALQMLRAVALPSKTPSLHKTFRRGSSHSQKSAVHSLGLEPLFSCFGDKFPSMPAKECHCSAPWHYSGKWSISTDLAVTFLSLLSCNGTGGKSSCCGFSPFASHHSFMLLSRPADLFCFMLHRRNARV